MKTTKLKNILISCMILPMIVSCTQEQSDNQTRVIDINLSKATPLKEAVISMNVIALQDSFATHFPGFINKLIWIKDSIFILDGFREKGLYLYNSDGMLTNSYTKKGNGPDEFISMDDFCVTSSEIVLLDNYSTSTRIYLDRGFSFQRKESAEKQAQHLFAENKSNGGIWYDRGNGAYSSNKDKLVYIKGRKRESVLTIPHEIENITFGCFNSFTEIAPDTILYLPPVEHRIYKCHNGKAEVLCELDFGDAWPDFLEGAKNQHPGVLMNRVDKEGKVYGFSILSYGKEVAISFYCKDMYYVSMFNCDDLSTHKLYKVEQKALESLGTLVTMKDGDLVFGQPGKLIRMTVK